MSQEKVSSHNPIEQLARTLGTTNNDISRRLTQGTLLEIRDLSVKLDRMPDKTTKEQEEMQKRLLDLHRELWYIAPEKYEALKKAGIEQWVFEHARQGMIPCGDIIIKLKRRRGNRKAHETNLINYLDWVYFVQKNPKLGIFMPKILMPFSTPEAGLFRLVNALDGDSEQIVAYAQAQELVDGSTWLRTTWNIKNGGYDLKPPEKRKITLLLNRLASNVKTWQEKAHYAPEVIQRLGTRAEPDIEDILRYKQENIEHSAESARQFTGTITEDDVKSMKEFGRALFGKGTDGAISREREFYCRKLDAASQNIMIRHPLGIITPTNTSSIFKFIDPENLVHVDTGVNDDHKAEDWHYVHAAYMFLDSQRPSSSEFYEKLREAGYSLPEFDHAAVGAALGLRVRYHTIVRFLRRYVQLRGTEGEAEKEIAFHDAIIRAHDRTTLEHIDTLEKLTKDDKKEIYRRAKNVVQKMSQYDMETLVERLEQATHIGDR
jgi:hypothetical protein